MTATHAADRCAKARRQPLLAPAGRCSRNHIRNARPRRDSQNDGSEEECDEQGHGGFELSGDWAGRCFVTLSGWVQRRCCPGMRVVQQRQPHGVRVVKSNPLARFAPFALIEAGKWNHNGCKLDGEPNAHNPDAEEHPGSRL